MAHTAPLSRLLRPGHFFWILSTSDYQEAEDRYVGNWVRRDIVSVPAGGWTRLRIVADNPGVWTVHW